LRTGLDCCWLMKDVLESFNYATNIFKPFEATFTFRWQLEVPKYVSDLDIYVWQRYRKPPSSQHAYFVRLFLVDQRVQRLVILLNSTAQLVKFDEQRCHILPWDVSRYAARQWFAVNEVILSIFAVCILMIGDTSRFLEGVNEQLDYLVFSLSHQAIIMTLINLCNRADRRNVYSSSKVEVTPQRVRSNIYSILMTVVKKASKVCNRL